MILHILLEVNVFQHLATLPGHDESFQTRKKAFLNDPKCQKQGFLDFGGLNWLDIAYYDRTKCFTSFGNTAMSSSIAL